MRAGFLTALFLSLFFASSAVIAQDVKEEVSKAPHLEVYYFYGNFRCSNCRNFEKYTKETLDKYFNEDVKKGRIVFKMVNIDKKANSHFVSDYQLYTKAVVLSLSRDGKEVKYKNLEKIWDYLGNKDKFQEYEKKEIEEFLKEI